MKDPTDSLSLCKTTLLPGRAQQQGMAGNAASLWCHNDNSPVSL